VLSTNQASGGELESKHMKSSRCVCRCSSSSRVKGVAHGSLMTWWRKATCDLVDIWRSAGIDQCECVLFSECIQPWDDKQGVFPRISPTLMPCGCCRGASQVRSSKIRDR